MKMRTILSSIEETACKELETLLQKQPELVNKGVALSLLNQTKAHPLHRICDHVFNKKYTESHALKFAKILLQYGADVNGGEFISGQDTPLIAASSLHADQLALLYIEHGANIQHRGCMGGTALHWAAWTGRDAVVKSLLAVDPEINQLCLDHKATPLFWAVHGHQNGNNNNRHHQVECARLLVNAGADQTIPNRNGHLAFDIINEKDKAAFSFLKAS